MSEVDPARDRVAVVSGAGTGVGRAIATKFGALGWRVAIGGRRMDRLAETMPLYDAFSVTPTAPVGAPPATFEGFIEEIMRRMAP